MCAHSYKTRRPQEHRNAHRSALSPGERVYNTDLSWGYKLYHMTLDRCVIRGGKKTQNWAAFVFHCAGDCNYNYYDVLSKRWHNCGCAHRTKDVTKHRSILFWAVVFLMTCLICLVAWRRNVDSVYASCSQQLLFLSPNMLSVLCTKKHRAVSVDPTRETAFNSLMNAQANASVTNVTAPSPMTKPPNRTFDSSHIFQLHHKWKKCTFVSLSVP